MEERRCEVTFHQLTAENRRSMCLEEEVKTIIMCELLEKQKRVSVWMETLLDEYNKKKIESEIDCLLAAYLKYENKQEAKNMLQRFFKRKSNIHALQLNMNLTIL